MRLDSRQTSIFTCPGKRDEQQIGERATAVATGSRGVNIHLIGCIRLRGLIYHQLRRGSFKKDDAKEWVKECLRKAKQIYGGPVALVIDNVPCHASIEEIFTLEEFSGHNILRLAPYTQTAAALQ